ncbi:hypothetical protein [Paremcibacter congregatus]|uniref:Uncharacterized protein n=1 Tax=Paremcibacter congregatus TaxID=2043170 RepID=A0A2G4YS95_9PROT|nr:hypothetical protein [Paremcibacter congregatus]PHZ85137.1 hypothetical protein CRD36_06905 [Paremcibacter congregatus]QDE27926.1 hypothetical protein FIV45_11915 [Paremcibacter congregatus]
MTNLISNEDLPTDILVNSMRSILPAELVYVSGGDGGEDTENGETNEVIYEVPEGKDLKLDKEGDELFETTVPDYFPREDSDNNGMPDLLENYFSLGAAKLVDGTE